MNPDELATLIEQILTAETDEARQAAFAAVTDLDATEAAMQTVAGNILADADASAEDLDTATALADALDHLRVERTRRLGLETAEADRRAALAARVSGKDGEVEGSDEETDEEKAAKAAEDPDGDKADEALAAETPAETEVAKTEDTPPAPAPTPKAPSLAAIRKAVPADAQPSEDTSRGRVSVKASMDVPGFRPGYDFSNASEIAKAMIARQEVLGKVRGGNVATEKVPVVSFNYIDELKQVGEDRLLNGLLLREAGAPDALTASGGFCAPAQIVYDFVKVNRPTDLAQDFLPVVGAPRGSVEYPDSPDIRDAFSGNISREYTNQNDIDEVAKVTVTVACPSFNTCVVGAQYVILQFGNFGTRAYPEWVEHWVGLSMDVHSHLVSRKLINQMVALSSAAVPVGPNAGATSTLISNLAMAGADLRHDLRMGREAPLEVVLPEWTVDLIRSDMARARKGRPDDTLGITDAQIMAWFRGLNLNPHFVVDWQDTSGNSSTGASAWPLGLNFLLYPPGTFVKLDMGTLDLGVVRDSTLNATNDYNIFVETFESVCKPGIESRLYSTSICANGAFSADQNLSCAGIDIPQS